MQTQTLPENLQQLLPLTPAVFFVLFSLAGGDKHGYAIMQETTVASEGKVRMGPGTLYSTLQRLLDLTLVQEVRGAAATSERESRRRYYRISRSGMVLLEVELGWMDSVVRLAKRRNLVPQSTLADGIKIIFLANKREYLRRDEVKRKLARLGFDFSKYENLQATDMVLKKMTECGDVEEFFLPKTGKKAFRWLDYDSDKWGVLYTQNNSKALANNVASTKHEVCKKE